MQIGFVGTGTMGNAIAGCLIDAGHRLAVHDVRPEAMQPLVARGAAAAVNPRAAAEASEVVFTSLPGPDEMRSAVLDPATGILAGLAAGGAYIDLTTNAPAVVREVARACQAKGVAMIDAPVSGRPPGMTVMAGGEEAVFERHRPLFAAVARNIFYLGPSGAGAITKLVTQYLGYTNFVAALEGLLIGAKAGVDPGLIAEIVPLSAGASRTFDNIPRSVLNRGFAAGGAVDIIAKDLALACELARAVGTPANLGLMAHEIMHRAQVRGWGRDPFPSAVRILEEMAGRELRSEAGRQTPAYQAADPRRDP